jgi:PBP1b-binding outer membrane lipoprotein LpoB
MKHRHIILAMLIALSALAWSGCSSSNRMGCPANKPYKYRGY